MMDVEARDRYELHRKLEQVLGEDHAMTLMRQLPQGPAASRQDVEAAGQRLDVRIDGVERRLDAKIDGVERRLDAKIDGVEQRLDAEIGHVHRELAVRLEGAEHRLAGTIHEGIGTLRGEMARQVRTHTFATIGALLTLAVIAFAAAGLA